MSNCQRVVIFLSISLTITAVLPRWSSAMECTARTLLESSRDHTVTGELYATVSDSDPYPQMRQTAVEVDPSGIRVRTLCENTSPVFTNPTAWAYGALTLDNVVFSSPGTDPIPVSLNLDFNGRFNLLDNTGKYAVGTILIEATIDGTTFPGEVHVCSMYCVQIQTGLLEGLTGRVFRDKRLTTPQVMVPVNEPVTVTLTMRVVTAVDKTPLSRAEGDFDDVYTFARSGPVFNVPAGVDVNSERSMIIDNAYYGGTTVPTEPTSWGAIKELYR
jgi:hypothetical protein